MNLFIYLLIFNLFIVDKFVSVTTGIALHKQQDLSETSSAANKIVNIGIVDTRHLRQNLRLWC